MVFWAAENIKIIFCKMHSGLVIGVSNKEKGLSVCVCVCLSDCESAWVRESAWESVRELECGVERDRDLTTYLSRLQHYPTFPCDKLGRVKEEREKNWLFKANQLILFFGPGLLQSWAESAPERRSQCLKKPFRRPKNKIAVIAARPNKVLLFVF